MRPWEWAAMDSWEWTMAKMVRSEWDEGVDRVDHDQKAANFLRQRENDSLEVLKAKVGAS